MDKNELPLSFRDRMFNFYEFPVQLHFTCRDKQKGENVRARLCVPVSRSGLAVVRSRKQERNTLAHSSAARAAAERGRGAREGGTARRPGPRRCRGGAALPSAGPLPPPRAANSPRNVVCGSRARPRLGEGERGLRRPPRRQLRAIFCGEAAGKGAEGRRGTQPEPISSEAASPGRPPQNRFTRIFFFFFFF